MQANRRSTNWYSRSWRCVWIVLGWIGLTGTGLVAQTVTPAGNEALATKVVPFMSEHCFRCHGPEKQKGDRRFDHLETDLRNEDTLAEWQDILDMINLGEMPPPEEDKRPGNELASAIAATLTDSIAQAQALARADSPRSLVRRMNRREYRNTINDLFGWRQSLIDPTEGFLDDKEEDGFDNLASAQTTSGYLLGRYLDAADRIITRATTFSPKSGPSQWKFTPPFDRTTGPHQAYIATERTHTQEYQSIYQGTKDRYGYRPLDDIKQGVAVDGYYRIRIKAAGLNRRYIQDEQIVGTDRDEPIRLALVSGSSEKGDLSLRQANERTLAVFDLPDDTPDWVEATIWLDHGHLPRMTYDNGPYYFRALVSPIFDKHPEIFPAELHEVYRKAHDGIRRSGNGSMRLTFQETINDHWWEVTQSIKTPQIRIHAVEMEGPLLEESPAASYRAIFGDDPFTPERTEEILQQFATRAFRRPVSAAELGSLVALTTHRKQQGDTPLDALKVGLKATLCSPGFLYIDTREIESNESWQEYRLASRLSYFLWSTMPDKELLRLAAAGTLSDPATLHEQTLRMLRDPRAQSFVADFTDHWLALYKLGKMPPDIRKFQFYYTGNLETAMRRETQLFFEDILQNNLDIENFIRSDFTYVNRPLARLYGMDTLVFPWHQGLAAEGFQRIELKRGNRGGLLGHASVLTATANGIDTSPVIRGIWVLNNILGTPPNPPPPNVEPLEPDIRGATTIREQLVKHRSLPTCFSCHSKIDPLGFALEEFNAIGAQRSHYENKGRQPVDTAGILPDHSKFGDLTELKDILAGRKKQFARCLTEKLLTYATGRHLTIRDRPAVDAIVESVSAQGYGMRDLVVAVTRSETFVATRPTGHTLAQSDGTQ